MKESSRALGCWEVYWSLGAARTLGAAAHASSASERAVKRWAHEFDWDSRIRARITAEAEAREQRRQARILAAEERLTAEGIETQEIATATLRRLSAEKRIGALAAVQALVAGAKLELRGLGQPESITAQQVTGADGGAIAVDVDGPRERLARRLAGLAERDATPGTAGGPDGAGS